MSINLGQAACQAALNLRSNEDFQIVRAAIEEQVRQKTYLLLELETAGVEHARGYAKAVFDMYRALEAATIGGRQTAVSKPLPTKSARQTELALNA